MLVSLKLDSRDINILVRSVRNTQELISLWKCNRFKLRDESLFFEQSFIFNTTVQVKLSCDDSGKLLITIIELTGNKLFNSFLDRKRGCITDKIESKTRRLLVREAENMLSLSPKRLPFPIEFRNVEIKGDRLLVTVETSPQFKNKSNVVTRGTSRFTYILLIFTPFVWLGGHDLYARRNMAALFHFLLFLFPCIAFAVGYCNQRNGRSVLAALFCVGAFLFKILWAVCEAITVDTDGNGVPMS